MLTLIPAEASAKNIKVKNKVDNGGEISIRYKNAILWNSKDFFSSDSNEKFYPGVSSFRQKKN